ncbi:MAG: hypothetical protein U1E27_04160, partial [Kiritimatiellia bacterium]|nr:hypothetical protein [Kiritimatiellia bacterium]
MIDLSRYIPRENILRVTARHHDDILRELLQPCFRDLPEKERLPLMDELLHSDAMKDQAMGNGFAITHTRRDGQANIRVAVGLLTPPTPFRRGPAVHTV